MARDVRAQLAALESAGQPITLAQLNNQNPSRNAARNAAPLYEEALSLYRDAPPEQWSALPFDGTAEIGPGIALHPETREATAAWIALNEGTLQKLEAARALEFCRYLDSYKPAGYNDLAVLRQLEILVKLACATAVFHADRGDSEAASAALDNALSLTRSMEATGLYTILVNQWETEVRVLSALQYAMSRCPLTDATLQDFGAYFSPARRREQIERLVTVERCLFLARIREGYRRGMGRNILIATGVGDLNARAYIDLMGHIAAWVGAPRTDQREIEARFDAALEDVDSGALLFLTLNISQPPGQWYYYRKALDEATLARVGVALYRFRAVHKYFPENLEALAPEISASDLVLQTTGEPMVYVNEGDRAEVHNGGLAEYRRGVTTGTRDDGGPVDRNNLERLQFVVVAP